MSTTIPSSGLCVEAHNLTYRYGGEAGHTAVDSIDLAVGVGEIYALLGTNGAGKTTTLEILEGHRSPVQGVARIFGADPGDRRRARPRVGMMLQESPAADDLTVSEMVRLGGAISGREDDAVRVLGRIGMSDRSGQRMGTLSGGERRRVDFGIAIWGSPDLVFLDEPTTGLDPEARASLWSVVAELQAAGTTVVLTTHYLEEAERYASRIGLMHAGRLRREGTVAELTAGYLSEIRFRIADTTGIPVAIDRMEPDGLAVVATADLDADLPLLLDWARASGQFLSGLRTDAPTLAQVFADLRTPALPTERN